MTVIRCGARPRWSKTTETLLPGAFLKQMAINPRVTTSSGYEEVSAHGWWVDLGCPSGTRASVEIVLQALTENGWYTVATGSRVIGPGTSKRANVRERCVDDRPYTYRSIIDVDLIGIIDTPERAVRHSQGTLNCGFAWN